jgi:hydroxymethylbilane synthase
MAALGREVELIDITTAGDLSSAPVEQLGSTGVFVSALRDALMAGEIDFAVHSYKDLPTAPAEGLVIAAVPPREDPRDALVARDGLTLSELPPGARIGTGAPRRIAQLNALGLGFECVPIRGNVDSRLRRVGSGLSGAPTDGSLAGNARTDNARTDNARTDNALAGNARTDNARTDNARTDGAMSETGALDAVVLARAGLARLNRLDVVTEVIDPLLILPAPAQGALAIECRAGDLDLVALLGVLDDPQTRVAVAAERSLLAALEAGCSAPVAAWAVPVESDTGAPELYLRASVTALDGNDAVRLSASGPTDDADAIGRRLAAELLEIGAATLMGSPA